MDDFSFWLQVIGLAINATLVGMQIYAIRTRPGAPPPSPMIRWSVFGSVTAAVSLIAFMFWLATRHPPG